MNIIIRNEEKKDYRVVEEMTREAFWNLYVPGCVEHYLVHIMRTHKDFVAELDFVLELDGKIAANIMYTKATLTDEAGNQKKILTFGPVCVLPEYQRKGLGSKLIRHSFEEAKKLGYDTVVIFGNPSNYAGLGFKSCQRFNMSPADRFYPTGMMVYELREGLRAGKTWTYRDSEVYHFDEAKVEEFDSGFTPKKKETLAMQESFYILSNSRVVI